MSYNYIDENSRFRYRCLKIIQDAQNKTNDAKKPPLGLKPKFILEEQRMQEIHEAIMRYKQNNYEVPKEWIEEYVELIRVR